MVEKRVTEHDLPARRVRIGDRILMPDGRAWCMVDRIMHNRQGGRLLLLFAERGFSDVHGDDDIVRVRRAVTP